MTRDELLKKYGDGERDFRCTNLSGAHLSGAHLSRAHLRGADLSGAHLRGTNLSDADLSGAHLSGAHLRGADLRGAHLRGTNLSDADLSGTNLSGADLSGTTIDGKRILSGAHHVFAPSPHGYWYTCFAVEGDDKWMVLAGCRRFTLAEAIEHWTGDERMDGAIEKWVLERLALLD